MRTLDVFTMNITLIPSEPVKAWELKLSYNHSLLLLLNITEGGFFGNYTTFYVCNSSLAYCLILGPGNVSSPGMVAKAVFRAVGEGETLVSLMDAGITNETRYLPLSLQDGNISITGRHWGDTEGWNVFNVTQLRLWKPVTNPCDADEPGSSAIKTGWNSFQDTVIITQGYNSFRNTITPDESLSGLGSILIVIVSSGVVIGILIRRLK